MELIKDKDELEKIDSTPETLEKNKEHLIEMLEEFEFSNDSEEKIITEIKSPSRKDFFGTKFDKTSQRIFYKITETDKKNLIEQIQDINKHYFDYNTAGKTDEEKEKLWKEGCYSKIIDMNNDAVRAIVESSRYLVVSRNPIDIVMCSTNQNFGSCFSMTSTYGYAFGVPALIPNTDLCVCYLTKGKHQNFSIHSRNKNMDYEFRFMKMLLRFFVYNCKEEIVLNPLTPDTAFDTNYVEETEEKDVLGIGYIYPKDCGKQFNKGQMRWEFIAELFEGLGIKTTKPQRKEIELSESSSGKKYPINENKYNYVDHGNYKLKNDTWFLARERTEDEYMNPYFDNITFSSGGINPRFCTFNGSSGSYTCMDSCNESPVNKIEKGYSLDEIINRCEDCDDEDQCCCPHCDEYYNQDDMYWIESNNEYVCEDCYNEYYFRCDVCDERFSNEKGITIYEIDSRGNKNTYTAVCQSCAEREYYFCEDCDEYYTYESMESTSEGMVCKECFDENFAECQGCGEAYRIGDMTEMLNEGYRCEDCYQGKAVTVKKFQNMNVIEFKLPWSSYFEIMEKFVNNKKASILDGLKLYNDIGTSEYDAKDTKTIVFIHGEKTNTVMHIEWE